MTYIASLDPNSPENVALDAAFEAWDADMPEWQDESLDPEDPERTNVSYWDVANVTEQDRADLQTVLDWEEHSLTL